MMNDSYNSSSSYMSKAGAYAILARATLYAGSVDPSLYSTADSAAKWLIANSGATPVGANGFVASFVTDNASNSIFELAMSGTDNRGINGIANILRGPTYGDVRVLTGDGTNPDLMDIYDVEDVREVQQLSEVDLKELLNRGYDLTDLVDSIDRLNDHVKDLSDLFQDLTDCLLNVFECLGYIVNNRVDNFVDGIHNEIKYLVNKPTYIS